MATSGSTDFDLTRDQIIKGALRNLGVLDPNETPTSEDIDTASEALNIMCKTWAVEGLFQWNTREYIVFLTVGQQSYGIGTGATDHVVDVDELVTTALAVAASSTDVTITVDSASDIASGDNIGIVYSSTAIHWTTVNGAPAGAVVTLTDAMPADAAVDAVVYAYTNKAGRPLQVTNARRRLQATSSTPSDNSIFVNNREEYFELPNKASRGKATQVYYDPQRTIGRLYVWPTADVVTDQVRLTCVKQVEDFDSLSNNADFPQEWISALKYGLAFELANEYTVPDNIYSRVQSRAEAYKRALLDYDQDVSVVIRPEYRR